MFGWICKHEHFPSSVLQFTSISCYHQEGRIQCQGLIRIMCASTPHFSFHLTKMVRVELESYTTAFSLGI